MGSSQRSLRSVQPSSVRHWPTPTPTRCLVIMAARRFALSCEHVTSPAPRGGVGTRRKRETVWWWWCVCVCGGGGVTAEPQSNGTGNRQPVESEVSGGGSHHQRPQAAQGPPPVGRATGGKGSEQAHSAGAKSKACRTVRRKPAADKCNRASSILGTARHNYVQHWVETIAHILLPLADTEPHLCIASALRTGVLSQLNAHLAQAGRPP